MPTPRVRPHSVSMFSVIPEYRIITKVARNDVGMEIAITAVELRFFRKRKMMITARIAPLTADCATEETALWIKSAWSMPTVKVRSGLVACSRLMVLRMPLETSTVLDSDCLVTARPMAMFPSMRLTEVCS